MAAIPTWQDLKEQYLTSLERGADWLDLWQLFVEHPWYQAELQAIGERLVRRQSGFQISVDDVKQDAMMLLARKLRSSPDMHLDPERIDHSFPGWLATIIRRDCQEALRHIRRPQPQSSDAVNDDVLPARKATDLEARIDLSVCLDTLPEDLRTLVVLHTKGFEIAEMAAELEISYWKARRLLQEGLQLLAYRLRPVKD
jgi:RNA polymerase sigma factor (sigma-70 family)